MSDKKSAKKTVAVRFDLEQIERLESIAKDMNGSMSDAVRFVVKQKLEDDELEVRLSKRIGNYKKENAEILQQIEHALSSQIDYNQNIDKNVVAVAKTVSKLENTDLSNVETMLKDSKESIKSAHERLETLEEKAGKIHTVAVAIWKRVKPSFFGRFGAAG